MYAVPITDPNHKVISNSEVATYNTCERRWLYAHYQGIMPIKYSTALTRGIIGHAALAAFYSAIKDGSTFDDAVMASSRVLTLEFIQPDADQKMLDHLRRLLDKYYTMIKPNIYSQEFDILEVEKAYILPLTSKYAYGMRLDVLVRWRKPGKHFGDLGILDHKFCYDFWSLDDLRMNAQIPKYMGVLRATGESIKFGVLNQLRYRFEKMDEKEEDALFRRDFIEPSDQKIKGVFTEQVKVSERLINLYGASPEVVEDMVARNNSYMNCRKCPFLDLCHAELENQDTTNMRLAWYTKNTYGYSPEVEAV